MIVSFSSPSLFRTWLKKNQKQEEGFWLHLFKKDSGKKSITYAEALDEALCFGGIDAQKKGYDDVSWIQRFCPRRPKSKWSKNNIQHVKRLIKMGKMTAGGLAEVNLAKADGRWAAAYDSAKNSTIPTDFLKKVKANKKAYAF